MGLFLRFPSDSGLVPGVPHGLILDPRRSELVGGVPAGFGGRSLLQSPFLNFLTKYPCLVTRQSKLLRHISLTRIFVFGQSRLTEGGV